MRLILVRHGQTPSNVAGLIDTAVPGPGLTELGHRQAAAIPQAFADRACDAVAISPLTRTSLTAAPFVAERAIEPSVHAGLREVEAGDLEMMGEGDAIHTYISTIFSWVGGELQQRMPGSESGHEFVERYDAAIAEIIATGAESAVVVSHGAAIRAWASLRARGVDLSRAERTTMPNTGFVALDGDFRGGWDLVEWSEHPAGGKDLDAVRAVDPTVAKLVER